MTAARMIQLLQAFPEGAEIYTEGGLTEEADVFLDDDGDVAIGPFLDDEDDEQEDDDEEDEG